MSLIIGISGGSGSGKTSFIRDLKLAFPADSLCVISQDDYYRPREEQFVDSQGIHNFDLPESIDQEAFLGDIHLLQSGQTVTRLEYTFNNKLHSPSYITFTPAPILIIEGLFIYHNPEVKKLLDLKIMVHASDSHKIIRRIKRDQKERNYPIDDVLYRYQHHVMPSYQKYIEPYLEEVDLIINNQRTYDPGIAVLKGYLSNHLLSLK